MGFCIRHQRIHSRQDPLSEFERKEKNSVNHEKETGQCPWTKVLVSVVVNKDRQ